jgi:IS4 transposase
LVIAQLYKCRWQIELFFKWIKQYLRIKTFFGISQNAVKTQIWITIYNGTVVVLLRTKDVLHAVKLGINRQQSICRMEFMGGKGM